MVVNSKRFTNTAFDKNLIVTYQSKNFHKFLFTINTTDKDFYAEFEMGVSQTKQLISFLQDSLKKEEGNE